MKKVSGGADAQPAGGPADLSPCGSQPVGAHQAQGPLMCRSCPAKFGDEAAYIANAYGANRDGTVLDWPLCETHFQYALIAGWFPIRKLSGEVVIP